MVHHPRASAVDRTPEAGPLEGDRQELAEGSEKWRCCTWGLKSFLRATRCNTLQHSATRCNDWGVLHRYCTGR